MTGGAAALAPPFRLPGEHFVAALLFLVLGAAGVVWQAPALAAGAYPAPRVVAITHLFTLGWLTTSIMGALYQFLPVALGTAIRRERLGHVAFWGHTAGLGVFVGGLATGSTGATALGASLFAAALCVFLLNLGLTLPRARRRDLTWWSVAGAGFFLLATVALGLVLVENLRTGLLGELRFMVVRVHLHVAAAGWVLLTIIGVSHRLLPMFLLSHGVPGAPAAASAALVAAGAAGLLLTHHVLGDAPLLPGGILLAVGTAVFLVQAGLHFRRRRRPALDPGLRLVAVALGLLTVALLLGAYQLASGGTSPRLATAYVAALVVGGLGLFVAGIYYKILPFLTWFHRFGPVAAGGDVPRVSELFDHRVAHVAGALLGTGAAGLVLAILLGTPAGVRAAGVAVLAGAGTETLQLLRVVRKGP